LAAQALFPSDAEDGDDDEDINTDVKRCGPVGVLLEEYE